MCEHSLEIFVAFSQGKIQKLDQYFCSGNIKEGNKILDSKGTETEKGSGWSGGHKTRERERNQRDLSIILGRGFFPKNDVSTLEKEIQIPMQSDPLVYVLSFMDSASPFLLRYVLIARWRSLETVHEFIAGAMVEMCPSLYRCQLTNCLGLRWSLVAAVPLDPSLSCSKHGRIFASPSRWS